MNKETQMMLVPQGSIEGYIRAANEYPMLTAEEEKASQNVCIMTVILKQRKN